MSYILEALKKAEQQRELGRVPSIETVHEQVRGKASGPWPWMITAIVAVNALILLLSLWPEGSREMPAPDADRGRQTSDAEPIAPLHSPPSAEPDREPVPTSEDDVLASDPVTERPAQEVRETTIQRAAPETELEPVPTVDPSYTAAAAPSAEESETGRSPLPVWPRIADYLVAELGGGLSLDVHVYAEQPQERFVLINLRKYQEGERLEEGPRLDEITTEGVILSYRGERFRVQAQ